MVLLFAVGVWAVGSVCMACAVIPPHTSPSIRVQQVAIGSTLLFWSIALVFS